MCDPREELRQDSCRGRCRRRYRLREGKTVQSPSDMLRDLGPCCFGSALLNKEQGRFRKVYWVTRVPLGMRVNTVTHEDLLSGLDVLSTTDCGLHQLMTVAHNSSGPDKPTARRQQWVWILLGVSVGVMSVARLKWHQNIGCQATPLTFCLQFAYGRVLFSKYLC